MTDLGKVLIMPKDEWQQGTTYEILDAVTKSGKAYISKKNNNTAQPSGQTDANWFLFAQDGTGTGDMSKSVYDQNDDGVVDAAESVPWSGITDKQSMGGASAGSAGSAGLVPAPAAGDQEKSLFGDGTWKNVTVDVSGKADKVSGAVNGNFAGLDSNGNLTDSGKKPGDFDISGKADKVTNAVNGNFAGLDSNGNLTDSGTKPSDFLTQHQDISWKQNKTLDTPLTIDGTSRTTVEAALGALNTHAGVKVSATVSGSSLAFTDASIGANSVIDGPYVADMVVGIDSVSTNGTTITYTLADSDANGKNAYIWVRN